MKRGWIVRLRPLFIVTILLPSQFKPKLNLTRRSTGGTNNASIGSQHGVVCINQEVRRGEVRMIHNIKELRSELYLISFLEVEILEYRKIHRRESGPIEPVASGATYEHASGDRGRRSETVWIESQQVAGGIVLNSRRRVAAGNQLRVVHREVAVISSLERVASSAESHCKRRTACRSDDCADLPSTAATSTFTAAL